MNNPVDKYVRTSVQIEASFMETMKKIVPKRKLYVQLNKDGMQRMYFKRVVKLSDSEINVASNQLGLVCCSSTNRSVTLRARDINSYIKAKSIFT